MRFSVVDVASANKGSCVHTWSQLRGAIGIRVRDSGAGVAVSGAGRSLARAHLAVGLDPTSPRGDGTSRNDPARDVPRLSFCADRSGSLWCGDRATCPDASGT